MTTPPMRRVVVTQRFFDDESRAFLQAHGCEVVIADRDVDGALSEDALVGRLDGADGWIVGHAKVTSTLLARLPRLRVISRRGVGYEKIDLDAVRAAGRVACIAVGGNDASVADHTLALMLAVGRRLKLCERQLSAGDWSIPLATDLYRKTVGLVGLGRIARGVVQRLRGFEATVLVCCPRPDAGYGREHGLTYLGLPELLERSDLVSVHAPLTADTRHLIDADALARMKPGSVLVNTARGGLVDDTALLAALESGHLAGAGLDVFESETDPSLKPVSERLLALPQVVATPHAGASTREGLDRTNLVASRNVVAALDGTALPAACVVADGRTPS